MLLCLEAGEAHNIVPGLARAEVRRRQGMPDVLFAEGVSTHAAFSEGSVNAFVCLLKTLETNEAVRIADLGQSIMVYVRAILALDEMPDNGK